MVWLIKLEKINNNDMFIKCLVIQIVLASYVDLLRPSNSLPYNSSITSSLIRHFFLTNHFFFIKQILKLYENWLLKLTQFWPGIS
jgi:hypothetical protein